MKKLVFSFLFSFLSLTTIAQVFEPLGPDNRYELGFGFSSLVWVRDYSDTLYAALAVTTYNGPTKVIIKRLYNSKWDTLSPLFAKTGAVITMDHSHTPFVFYADTSVSSKGTVEKYTGGSWITVGNTGFTNVPVTPVSIAVGKADTLYTLFVDSGKISVMKFDGVNWDSVGNKRFATVTGTPQLAFDTAGTPYVAYSDPNNLNGAFVKKYMGGSWVLITPSSGLSTTLGANGYDMVLDSANNYLYLKFTDVAAGVTIKKYDGSSWQSIGLPSLISNAGVAMSVNSSGTLYLGIRTVDSTFIVKYNGTGWLPASQKLSNANSIDFLTVLHDTIPLAGYYSYGGNSYGNKPVIAMYSSTGWEKQGPYGFVAGGVPKAINGLGPNPEINYLRTVVNDNNIPYVVFSDSTYSGRLSLMNYDNGNWTYAVAPGFTAAFAYPLQFEKGKGDTLYILYWEAAIGLKFARFDGSSITNISSGLPNQTYMYGAALAMDTARVPYIAYPDPSNFNITTVRKFTNGNWSIVGSLPCTTQVQMQINSQNEVYAMYNTGSGSSLVSNLGKLTSTGWTSIVQSPLQGLIKIAPNDSLYFTVGRVTQFLYTYTYRRELYSLAAGSWNFVSSILSTPSSPPPPMFTESYTNVVFDTNSVPYCVDVLYDHVTIMPMQPIFWAGLYASGSGWHPAIKAANFDIAFGPANNLVAVYSQGTAYALSIQTPAPLPAPQIVSPVYYCQGDSASPLIATGQNLEWFGLGVSPGSSVGPVPSTAVAGTFQWYVRQVFGMYQSPASLFHVIVYPHPLILASSDTICAGDTVYLTASDTSGTVYHWSWIHTVNGTPVTTTFDSVRTIAIVDSGSYFVSVDSAGCISDTVLITMVPAVYPSVTITATPGTVTTGQQVTAIATVTGTLGSNCTVYWYLNGVLLPGTGDTLQYSPQAGTDTLQAVVVSTTHCVFPDTSNAVTIDVIDGIEDISSAVVRVSPNPSTGTFTVTAPYAIQKIEVTDIAGKEVYSAAPNSMKAVINLQDKASGVYFYTATIKGRKLRGKLVRR